MIKINEQNSDYLSKLEMTALKILTESTAFNSAIGMTETTSSIENFDGNVGNFSVQGMAAINATRVEENYLVDTSWRIITTKDILMTAEIQIDSKNYKVVYKKEMSGYFVYGVNL